MVDLAQMRYARDSLNERTAKFQWHDIHGRNTAVYMLEVYADYLEKGKYPVLPENAAKYLKMANQYGIPTGIRFPR
jgi:hypothetical protein